MLVKSKIKKIDIEKAFSISFKTINKYVYAFENNLSDEDLKKALKNPGREIYKLTAEIKDSFKKMILKSRKIILGLMK